MIGQLKREGEKLKKKAVNELKFTNWGGIPRYLLL